MSQQKKNSRYSRVVRQNDMWRGPFEQPCYPDTIDIGEWTAFIDKVRALGIFQAPVIDEMATWCKEDYPAPSVGFIRRCQAYATVFEALVNSESETIIELMNRSLWHPGQYGLTAFDGEHAVENYEAYYHGPLSCKKGKRAFLSPEEMESLLGNMESFD